MAISVSLAIFISHTVSSEDSAATTATDNSLWLLLLFVCNVSHSGIILTSDANWIITVEKMTSTNKVKAMVSGDMFIHILVHVAVLIFQVRV